MIAGPGVDERAMYLRGNADFFDEGGQFGNNNAKFKLAFNIRSDIDVFSQVSVFSHLAFSRLLLVGYVLQCLTCCLLQALP